MLSRCFFLLVWGSPVGKTSERLSRDGLVENLGVLWWIIIRIFDHSSFQTFPGISKNLSGTFSIFFLVKWWAYVCWLRKSKPYRGLLDEILHCSKKHGSGKANSVEVNGYAHVACALRRGRVDQFRSPYSWITMRRSLHKRRVLTLFRAGPPLRLF